VESGQERVEEQEEEGEVRIEIEGVDLLLQLRVEG